MGRNTMRTSRKYSSVSRFRHEETQQSRGFPNLILTGEYELTCTPGLRVLERDSFQCQRVRSGKIESQKTSDHAGS